MSRYLYNGVELPALPEWDKEAYPYAVIGKNTYSNGPVDYWFVASDTPFTTKDDTTASDYGNITFFITKPVMYKTPVDQTDIWESHSSCGYSLEYVWSNHDLYGYTDNSVLVYQASDPVPVPPANADLYIKKGNKVYKASGGGSSSGGTNILTFDSVEEMNAATAEEGAIAIVPSEGASGGLTVVELTTLPTEEGAIMTTEENAKLSAAIGKPVIISIHNIYILVFSYIYMEGSHVFLGEIMTDVFQIVSADGETWAFTIISNG